MVSRLARRSGVAVVQIAEQLWWTPSIVLHVGVGLQHAEAFIMKRECWPAITLHGYEPHPQTYEDIKASYPGQLRQMAIGNHIGEVEFYSPSQHRDGSSVFRRADNDSKYTVPMSTLDALYPDGLGGRCLLWIDAEGNDLAVLEGATKILPEVDMINIETTACVPPGWADATQIDRWLREHDFRRQWVHTQRIHVGQQDCIYVRTKIFDPAICPCPCQLEGLPVRHCADELSFFEVSVKRDLRAESKPSNRRIPAGGAVVVRRDCQLQTKGTRRWQLRWCGYAKNEAVALDAAREVARDILAGRLPDWVQVTAG